VPAWEVAGTGSTFCVVWNEVSGPSKCGCSTRAAVSRACSQASNQRAVSYFVSGTCRAGERVGTPFPLLKCLRTHYGRDCDPFSGQKCTRLQDFAYIQSQHFPSGDTPDPAETPHGQVLGPRHPCPLSSSAFPLFRFYETTTGIERARFTKMWSETFI